MSINHIYFSQQSEYGARLRSALGTFEAGYRALIDFRDVLQGMVEGGDTSNPANFTEAGLRFGFGTDATGLANAKAALDELNSMLGKLTTDATVDHVNAAILQGLSKLR